MAAAGRDELQRAYRLLLGSEGAYWERNLRTGDVWFSDRFFDALGIDPNADASTLYGSIHPDDRAEFGRRYQVAVEAVGPLSVDLRYRGHGRHYRWVRIQGRVWAGADGRAERVIGMAIDVDAEKQAQLELQRLTDQFDRAMAASQEVHFERPAADGRLFISRRVNALLGLPPDHPLPSPEEFRTRVHPDDLPDYDRIAHEAERGPGSWHGDYRLRRADGSYRWVRARGRTERLADGQLRTSGMIGDVHEEREARRQLIEHREQLQQTIADHTASLERALAEARHQREQAERANEAKSTFLAHMSHEIRTPLNGLLGLNEMALREARSEQQRRYLKLALQSGTVLLEMLNGVLDFSRLNAGAAPRTHEPFDLAEALASAVRRALPQARDKGLSLLFDYAGPVTLVIGDAQRLQQIVANLLANAIKYTGAGHVTLCADVRSAEPEGCRALIDVRDSGPGMTAQVAARIFDPFVQGDESLARRHGGSGLGLSIARGLARALGGELSVETSPGAGACFRLELPLACQPVPQPLEQLPEPGLAWVVTARPRAGEMLAQRLQRFGWQTMVLGVAALLDRTAVGARTEGLPDLVLVAESALDSPDTPFALRDALPRTPIVLVVQPDWNQPAIEAAARASDMPVAFMPLTPGALLELTMQRGSGMAAESGFAELGELGAAGADILVAEDNPVNQLIITEMIGALGLRPRLAPDGAAAVAACLEQAPELLLMDLQMPEVDGLEAARRLTALQRAGRLAPFPIVALTAHATPQDKANCLDAGMKGYLTKPITLAQLRSELARWLVR